MCIGEIRNAAEENKKSWTSQTRYETKKIREVWMFLTIFFQLVIYLYIEADIGDTSCSIVKIYGQLIEGEFFFEKLS